MSARLLSLVVWALAAASVVFWVSRFTARPAPTPGHASTVGPAAVPAAPLTRLFGVPPPPPPVEEAAPQPVVADARFKLIGVAAARSGQRSGLALIAVDDKPARAVPIGGRVDGELVVLSISHRQVDIGTARGPVVSSLTLPALPEANRGVPGALSGAAAPTMPGMQPQQPMQAPAMPGLPYSHAPAVPGAPVYNVPGSRPPTMPGQLRHSGQMPQPTQQMPLGTAEPQ